MVVVVESVGREQDSLPHCWSFEFVLSLFILVFALECGKEALMSAFLHPIVSISVCIGGVGNWRREEGAPASWSVQGEKVHKIPRYLRGLPLENRTIFTHTTHGFPLKSACSHRVST